MKSINLFIKENVESIGDSVYVAPKIPEKKLNNAIKAFGCEKFQNSILAIQDGTIFGGADEGFVFTGGKMIHHKQGTILYKDIISVEMRSDTNSESYILIKIKKYNLKKEYVFKDCYGIDLEKFAEFLDKIATEFSEYEEEDQLITISNISNMSNKLKIAYLKIIINMTFDDDEQIDEKELAELFLLMTRLELDKDTRGEAIAYITNISKKTIEPVENILKDIKENSASSHHRSLMISLATNLINTHFSANDTMSRDCEYLMTYQSLFGLTNEEVELAYDTVENDNKLIDDDMDDNTINKNMKELEKKAKAIDVPLGAVYLSGSTNGMTTANMATGFPKLGLVAVGFVGILLYKGVVKIDKEIKNLVGTNELDKYKNRISMLHNIANETKKTITELIDDMSHMIYELNKTITNETDQKQTTKQLAHTIAKFQATLKIVDNKANKYRNTAVRLKNPNILDDDRLIQLTKEPSKKPLYDFVKANYELKKYGKNGKRYMLKSSINIDVLNEMSEIFRTLGYFDIDNIINTKTTEMVNKLNIFDRSNKKEDTKKEDTKKEDTKKEETNINGWYILGGSLVGVAAVAAAPFTGGGSVLGAASLGASLGTAGAITGAVGAGTVGAIIGASIDDGTHEQGVAQGKKEATAKSAIIIQKQKKQVTEAVEQLISHADHYNLILAMTAVGIATANSDGTISPEELEEINKVVSGVSSAKLPTNIKEKILNMVDNPPSIDEAFGYVKMVGGLTNYELFDDIIDMTIKADGEEHPKEIEFRKRWKVLTK